MNIVSSCLTLFFPFPPWQIEDVKSIQDLLATPLSASGAADEQELEEELARLVSTENPAAVGVATLAEPVDSLAGAIGGMHIVTSSAEALAGPMSALKLPNPPSGDVNLRADRTTSVELS